MPIDLITLLSPKNLILFVVVFTRLSGLMTSAPLISTYPIPMQIKVWFMAMVAFIMFPMVLAQSHFPLPTSIPELSIILLKEFLIGYLTGFISNLVFIGVEIAADLVSMQVGLTAAQALNPMTGDTSPVLSQAYTILAAMIFIGINGYQWVFSAIYKTFQIMPPGYEFIVTGNLTHNVVVVSGQLFAIGLGIALPVFSVLLMTDVLLGVVSKMMPKMNIFMVALPVKIYLGIILIIMLLPSIYTELQLLLERYLGGIITILGGH